MKPPRQSRKLLTAVLRDARAMLARPGNDFLWSGWNGADDALREIDAYLAAVESGSEYSACDLSVLFLPTGPIQEVSLSSGWGDEFLDLAARFDAAARSGQ